MFEKIKKFIRIWSSVEKIEYDKSYKLGDSDDMVFFSKEMLFVSIKGELYTYPYPHIIKQMATQVEDELEKHFNEYREKPFEEKIEGIGTNELNNMLLMYEEREDYKKCKIIKEELKNREE